LKYRPPAFRLPRTASATHRLDQLFSFVRPSEPEVRREAEATRRRALGQAIGRLSSVALKAANGILTLAKEADSESVQLRAWRAVLADNMAIAKFSDLEYRMTEIEEELGKRTGYTYPAR
jgi:hypothetical protein